jgi:SAM-dependent methyltransferase
MNRQEHWQNVYETKMEDEVSWYQEHPASSLALIQNTGLDFGARIIDIGGGASRLVDHLLSEGCRNITILDIAAAALEQTRHRLGPRAADIDWLVADVTRWTPSAKFDLWHDRAVFHFLTEPADRAAYATAMAAALPTGGHAIIGTFAPDGPERCSGLTVCRYGSESLAAAFSGHFQLVEALREDHVTPVGKVQHFQFCRFRRL